MKKKFSIAIILFFVFSLLSASSWKTDSKTDENMLISNEDGFVATISHSNNLKPDDNDLQKIQSILDVIISIPNLETKTAFVSISDLSENLPRYRIVVIPSKLLYDNTDLHMFLPSGLAFYYDSSLFYDITMKVDFLLPRVTGAYISPDDMLALVYDATKNPEQYMYDKALLSRIRRLENALMAVSKKSLFSSKLLPVDSDVIDAVLNIYNANPEMSKSDIVSELKKTGQKISNADVNAVLMVYLGIFE